MNRYEYKQQQRKERLEARATSLQRQGESAVDRARRMSSVIPFGQPILVGHHSEKGDRNYRNRIHNTFGKGFALQAEAQRVAQRAAAVGSGGISSDDPDAIDKLREKLAKMEAEQVQMKAINAAHKHFLKNSASLETAEFTDPVKASIRSYKPAYSWEPNPFAPYQLTNLSANIRRVKARIDELATAPSREDATHQRKGFEIVHNTEDNRIQIIFPGKPSAEVRDLLKANGFRWAPSASAWQRQLNNAGIYAATSCADAIEKLGVVQ